MSVRLVRYLAQCGVASRRKAGDIVKQGLVAVNGEATDNPALDVAVKEREVEVTFADRRWVFPKTDCVLLPVANATAEHIKFTGLLGSAVPIDSSGQGTSPISHTFRCELVAPDDSTLPLTINTGATIS